MRNEIVQSPIYKADLQDVNMLASSYFDWISTLIGQAKKSGNHTLLDIAEYLADCQAVEFAEQANKL